MSTYLLNPFKLNEENDHIGFQLEQKPFLREDDSVDLLCSKETNLKTCTNIDETFSRTLYFCFLGFFLFAKREEMA